MIMRLRRANIRLIHRRSNRPRLWLARGSKKQKQPPPQPHSFAGVDRGTPYQPVSPSIQVTRRHESAKRKSGSSSVHVDDLAQTSLLRLGWTDIRQEDNVRRSFRIRRRDTYALQRALCRGVGAPVLATNLSTTGMVLDGWFSTNVERLYPRMCAGT